MDSNVEIAAPVVGDIGSCVAALLRGMGDDWPPPPADWTGAIAKKEENIAKMAPRLMNNNSPMDYHGALGVLRDHRSRSGRTPSWSTKAPTRSISRAA
jgi:oxalyl-CoA decarboxylase